MSPKATLSRNGAAAAQLEALDERRRLNFDRMMDLVADAHPYYRERLRELGLSRADFRSVEDLAQLPITRKADYTDAPDAFRLRSEQCPDLGLAERTIHEVVYTTGSTSGNPSPFYDTTYDHVARMAQLKEAATWAGIGPDDTVANLFPITSVPHQGFLSALHGPLTVGAKVIRGFTGRRDTDFDVYQTTAELAEHVARQRATVLWGIASFVRRLILKAQELELDFSSVRLAFVAGEHCPAATREVLRRRLTELGAIAPSIQNGYGFTEMQGPTIECQEGGSLHVPAASQYQLEIVQPETHAPLPDGEEGLVLVSHLNRRGTVLLRYAVGDVSAVEDGPCPDCGRVGPRFVSRPRRIDNLIKVKGTLVNPALVTDALASLPGVDEFQVVVDHAGADGAAGDEMVVRYTPAAASEPDEVGRQISAAVTRACELTPRVQRSSAAEFEALADDYKFKRFVDRRRS